ncbi:MAG: anti-sigma factor family protein [Solirubrobacterales bacterium]
MTCTEFTERVTDLLEGKLDAATMAEIDAHLAECDGCENYLEQMRATIEALRGLEAGDGFEHNREQALAAFRDLHASR